jgi:virginiamycin A acetyltransferase
MIGPDKNIKFPLQHYDRLCFLKNVVKNRNIIVGDYTYYDDFENVEYLFDFVDDNLQKY